MSSLKEKWKKIKQFGRKKKKKKDEEELGGADYDWYRDLESHRYGSVSMAVVTRSPILEDHSQVESHGDIFFVGVYDGYHGPDASNYICQNLYRYFLSSAKRQRWIRTSKVSEEVLGSAILATEKGFLSLVDQRKGLEPSIVEAGSSCLVGVIQRETLYVANLGDSRAVLGFLDKTNRIVAHQLNKIHNAKEEEVREEIMRSHPYGRRIVAKRDGEWRIKGINQVSRAIGDAYLKNPAYFSIPSHPLSDLPEQLRQPVLTAEPELVTRIVKDGDRFLIFASHGFWEHISNEEAVDFVHTNPPRGIARELYKKVLKGIAENCHLTYDQLEKTVDRIEKRGMNVRGAVHDDITVVVVFIDYDRLRDKHKSVPPLSIRGFSGRSSKHGTGMGEASKQGGASNQSGSLKDKDESSKQDRASKLSKWIKNAWVTKTIRNDKGRSSKHEIEKGTSLKQGGSLNQSGSPKQKDQSSEMQLDKGKQPAWD